MQRKRWIPFTLVGLVAAATTAHAINNSFATFRTTAILSGLVQGEDPISHAPRIDRSPVAGRDLVDLAMGRPIGDTTHPEQVLATTIACDLATAELVVLDRLAGTTLATIAQTTRLDALQSQGPRASAPNGAYFVASFDVAESGNVSNGITGGYATVAGRLHLDEQTGCPHAVLLMLDRDPEDKRHGDGEVSAREDADEIGGFILRAGHAHLIGVLELVSGGTPKKVLVPVGRMSLRRSLPDVR